MVMYKYERRKRIPYKETDPLIQSAKRIIAKWEASKRIPLIDRTKEKLKSCIREERLKKLLE